MPTYELCKRLLERGKLTAEMLDLFAAAGRITPEQYRELMTALNPRLIATSSLAESVAN